MTNILSIKDLRKSYADGFEALKGVSLDIEEGEISKHKDKPIVTYCTGGIRCEILSSYMKNRGYDEVYQMDGGIVKYGERYKNDGYWEGKLYVFDGRMVTSFSEDAEDLGDCVHCEGKTSNFENCMNKQCNKLTLQVYYRLVEYKELLVNKL